MAVWWSKDDFSFLSMRVCVCLKIMTPKGKQDYVRHITERARELMESSRRRRKKESRKWENWRKKEWGSFWNQVEVKKIKRRGCTVWWVYVCGKTLLESSDGYTCVVDKMQEKKKRKKKKERYGWKKRQRIRNHHLKIIPQYFHNKF